MNSIVRLLCVLSPLLPGAGPGVRTDEMMVVPDGGRTRANAFTRMALPERKGSEPVLIDVIDPTSQVMWTGASRGETFQFFTRDWADGTYTVRFDPGGEQIINVETEFFDQVRARCGLMLRAIEAERDADGMAPVNWRGASNLLQRVMTIFVWALPKDHVAGHLAHCEQQLGFKTDTETVRILGSGASEYTGYDGAYRPFVRERTMMFMPPDAVVEFAAHAQRKLERWGYSPRDINHLFITHEHADHFDEQAVADFAAKRRKENLPPVVVHSGQTVCDRLKKHLSERKLTDQVVLDLLKPGDETQAGALRVKAVLATHQADPDPLCFIMHWRGTTVYYGADSGYPSAATLKALAAERFDVFAHDLTVASADDGVTHMDLGDMMLLVGKLRAAGAIDTWTRVVALHQSPQGAQVMPDYNQFERMAGFECSYDGMPLPVAFRVGNGK